LKLLLFVFLLRIIIFFMQVNYVDSKVNVDLGNFLTPTQVCAVDLSFYVFDFYLYLIVKVQHQPEVKWNAEDNEYYTLIMTDPDAPSRAEPKLREWHHWLVVNIPGNKVSEGEVKSGYVGSGPPPGTGLHRYVFLVYKQNGKQDFKDVAFLSSQTATNREKFSARYNFRGKKKKNK
jgi:hypothetical protein